MMIKVALLLAIIAVAHGGVIAPVLPLAHPVVAHPVVAHPVVGHHVVAHPVAVSHSSTLVHHTPLVHAPVVPIVKHAPLIAVHH